MGFAVPLFVSVTLTVWAGWPLWAPDKELLTSLWQVQGAVVGFGVAVALFGFEALTKWGPVSTTLARSAYFPVAIHYGLAGLALTGVATAASPDRANLASMEPVLARWSEWLSLIAVIWSAMWILILLFSFQDAVRAAHPEYRHDAFRRLLAEGISAQARESVLFDHANTRLRDLVTAAGGEHRLWLSAPTGVPHAGLVRSRSTGDLLDTHADRLVRALRLSGARGNRLTVALTIGQQLRRGAAYAYGEQPVHWIVRLLLDRAIHVRPAVADPVGEILDELTAETRDSIGNASVVRRYLDTLDVTLDAYTRFYGGYQPEHQSLLGFRDTPIELARQAIYDLMRAALARDSRDAALALSYYPVHALSTGVRTSQDALFRFLSLMPAFYLLAATASPPAATHAIIRERSWFNLIQALQLVLPGMTRPEMPPVDAAIISRAAATIRAQIVEIVRLSIRGNDFDTFAELMRQWRIAEQHTR